MVAFRSSNSTSITGATTVATVTKPTGTVDTDFLIAFQSIGSSGSQASLTGPAGWANTGFGGTDANTGVIQTWTKVASGEGASWDWGKSNVGNMCVSVLCFSNPAATPLDGSVIYDQNTTAGTTATSSGITTAFTNDILVVCIDANSGAPTISTPTGMTLQTNPVAGATNTHATFTQAIAAIGATGTRASTLGTSQKWVTAAVGISGFVAAFVSNKIVVPNYATMRAANY